MTTEQQEEAGPVTLELAACSVCDAVFLMSSRRETSPCHGADPILVVATLVVGCDGDVMGQWGVGPAAAAPDITEEAAPPAEEEPPASAEEQEEGPPPASVSAYQGVTLAIENYLFKGEGGPDELRQAFLFAGAEPESAAVSVGRLEAVRAHMDALFALCHGEPVAPAPPEAESSPENT